MSSTEERGKKIIKLFYKKKKKRFKLTRHDRPYRSYDGEPIKIQEAERGCRQCQLRRIFICFFTVC